MRTRTAKPKGKLLAFHVLTQMQYEVGRGTADLVQNTLAGYRLSMKEVSVRHYKRTASADGVNIPIVVCIIRGLPAAVEKSINYNHRPADCGRPHPQEFCLCMKCAALLDDAGRLPKMEVARA